MTLLSLRVFVAYKKGETYLPTYVWQFPYALRRARGKFDVTIRM